MVKDRLSLHNLLLEILDEPYVYFQPPSGHEMDYPCIIYRLAKMDGVHANDKRYLNTRRYLVTVVDEDPDSELPDKIFKLPYCAFEDHFVVDNLNHYIYSLYY